EAGLPGIGLLRLLCAGGLEDPALVARDKHGINAVGTFMQLAGNLVLPFDENIFPEGLDWEQIREAMDGMSEEALQVATRIKSPPGQRLLVAPLLIASKQYEHLRSRIENEPSSGDNAWGLWLIAAISTILLVAALACRLLQVSLEHHQRPESWF